jgi:hypothetical protein
MMGDRVKGHFYVGGLKVMKDRADGHRYSRGPRFKHRRDICKS